jgi:deoxycytidylate deaminase
MATAEHKKFFDAAAEVAQHSLCLRRKCGSVVVKNGQVIGSGYNAPPGDDITQRRCRVKINKYAKNPTDKTCCIHAEQRAILDALEKYPAVLAGADLYYASISETGELQFAGKPYCTHCSKLALDTGIVRFGLWHRAGPELYEHQSL